VSGPDAHLGGLRKAAQEYLTTRRALGFALTTQAKLLLGFIDYCEARGATRVTTDLAVAWAIETKHSTDPLWWARRLQVVRVFARHAQALDPTNEVPGFDVLPMRTRRRTPYPFTDAHVQALMGGAEQLSPPLRAATWTTLVGLLAVTGLRVGEACHLQRRDVDLVNGVLTVRDSKFGKSRRVPVHLSTVAALRAYAAARDEALPAAAAEAFLLSTRGTALDPRETSKTFRRLLEIAGITAPLGQRPPRAHDLRHYFTITTLLGWYEDGRDVQPLLPLLSTYLGHVNPRSTYWYLQATPELLALAVRRLECPDRDEENGEEQ